MAIIPRNSGCSYTPILRTKRGELSALKRLTPQVAARVSPLLMVTDTSIVQTPTHIMRHVTQLKQAWPHAHNLFIDANILEVQYIGTSLIYFNHLIQQSLPIAPAFTIGLSSSNYINAIKNFLMTQTNPCVCIRLLPQLYPDPNTLSSTLLEVLKYFKQFQLRIIVDMLELQVAQMLIPYVRQLIDWIASIHRWADITLAGSSFPKLLPPTAVLVPQRISRQEWQLWDAIRQQGGICPSFGDYTCQHCTFEDFITIPSANIAPKLRYTTDLEWIVVKGHGGQNQDYVQMAQTIINLPEFCGPQFSYGDKFIHDKSSGSSQTLGNHESRVVADENHHITYVVSQL